MKKIKTNWLYSQTVKEHFLNPKNVLWDEKNYRADGKGTAGNPVCGDVMMLWIKVDSKTQKIKECKWRTYGCGAAIASTSVMSVMVTEKGGMSLKKALNLKPQEIVKRLGGLPSLKFHCSVLGQIALREAINDYLKKQKRKNNIFVLKEKIRETGDVLTLKFSPFKGPLFSFRPGQFVLVSFLDNRLGKQCRPYSISSCPQDKFLALTVKKLGPFSSALHNLKVGEKIEVSLPHGHFYPKKSMKNLVFLAAGVGIAPFYSLIKSFYLQGASEKITLFYSNRTKKEIIFFKELNEIAQDWPSFKIIYLLTREKIKDEKFRECCRLNTKILKKYLKNLKGKHYFICGPIEFVNDLWKELKRVGVKENLIKTEAFY